MIGHGRRSLAAVLLVAASTGCARSAQLPAQFAAMRHDAAGTHDVGRVSLDASAHLAVLDTVGDGAWLRALVTRTNAVETEHVDAAPPPGSPRYADVSAPITRADPRYAAAMRRDLLTYDGLELVPIR